MKLKTSLALALLLAAGCAQKKAEQPPSPAMSEPQEFAPSKSTASEEAPGTPPSTGGAAVCDSPECDEACADAGEDLKSACAEAFAKGCMSNIKPDPAEFDCGWEKEKKKKKGELRAVDTKDEDEAEGKALTKPPAENEPEARMEDVMDAKDDKKP